MEIAKLKESILTIGRTLPLGMECHFDRVEEDQRVRMQIISPDGSCTEYAFLQPDPLPPFPLNDVLLRESQRQSAMMDLLAAVEANHAWHQNYDEYGGYSESELCQQNIQCISVAKGILSAQLIEAEDQEFFDAIFGTPEAPVKEVSFECDHCPNVTFGCVGKCMKSEVA